MSKVKFIELPGKHRPLYVDIFSVVLVYKYEDGISCVCIGGIDDDNTVFVQLEPQEIVARLEAATKEPTP